MAGMYDALFAQHDAMLQKRLDESSRLDEREAKKQRLAGMYDELLEMPALASFIQIHDNNLETNCPSFSPSTVIQVQADEPSPDVQPSQECVKRDGFERIQR